jgi:hypothetical protein
MTGAAPLTTIKPSRTDLGWRWQAFAGRWLLVTDGGGAQVVLTAKHHAVLQTRDPETGILRDIVPSDQVAKIIAASADVRRHAQTFLSGFDVGAFSFGADSDLAALKVVLGELRAALAKGA